MVCAHFVSCYPEGCAAASHVQCQCNARGSLSKLAGLPPRRKINVTSKSPVGDISVVTLIRTDTTLDHSQKAEKVWQGFEGRSCQDWFPQRSADSSGWGGHRPVQHMGAIAQLVVEGVDCGKATKPAPSCAGVVCWDRWATWREVFL